MSAGGAPDGTGGDAAAICGATVGGVGGGAGGADGGVDANAPCGGENCASRDASGLGCAGMTSNPPDATVSLGTDPISFAAV